ncbi:TauD/TfdA dioxygenase family protein [Psychrobacter sp. LV10R520-6]|uniref:TauD/TfdA dioxygenase family protein n=1 Tax=Psychrobacter sp. LV10R520-6 TaxID=1415574 RepID=UPI0024CBA967|nr:TauD/TfdA family dioxygenase [Psychrobacter sp. LV10R520-6]SNT70469.1 taurine dioxygenase [Psychrobacter sp. LV10R520-6]
MRNITHPTGLFDNSARDYKHITALPLASAMGAEIQGVDLSNVSDDAMAEIQNALYRHKLIFFRDQDISFTDHENLTLKFGEFGTDAYTKGVVGHENIQPVIKEASTETKMVFGSGWHTDSAFLECPPSVAINYGIDMPPYGGDTLFANSVLAYNSLSPAMKEMIDPLKVWMSAKHVVASMQAEKQSKKPRKDGELGSLELDVDTQKMIEGSYHPLVRTHPVSGEKSLYVDKTYACGIEGMTEEESRPLLDFLSSFATQESFVCRLKWHNNTLIMWDNRICLHQAFNDYDGYRREMYRAVVMGEKPE